jgi:EAL domain-containing protein (putative c-di-GMP-specific phosphodiesterase class I)
MQTFSAPFDELTADERCARCEVLPSMAFDAGRLYLDLPVAFVLRKTHAFLDRLGLPYSDESGIIAIDVAKGALPELCAALEGAYSPVEREAIRAMFIGGKGEPALRDFLSADSLQRLSARSRAGQLVETLGGFLTCAFQPIFDAASGDIFAYEGLLRTTPGAPLTSPDQIFSIARAAELLPHADLAARRTVIARAAEAGITQHLFINFCPSAVYDPASCLRSTIEALDAAGFRRDRVVFEVVESDEVKDHDYLLSILRSYRNAGFKVALDDLGAGFASLNLLHALRPDIIKLDIALVRDVDRDPFKGVLAKKLIEAAHDLGITVVAEGIETATELQWLIENGAQLLQGFYLGRPAVLPKCESYVAS